LIVNVEDDVSEFGGSKTLMLGFYCVVTRRQERHHERSFFVRVRSALKSLRDADDGDIRARYDCPIFIDYYAAESCRGTLRINVV
jgi:hypothetical protein